MNLSSKISGTLQSRRFILGLSVVVAGVFFAAVYYFAQFQHIFQYNSDEGLYFMRAFLHMQGDALYSDIWMDQPPVLVKLLTLVFQGWGASVVVARATVLLIIALMMMALFFMIGRTQHVISAMATMAMICSIPGFLKLSVSTMNGLPAIALSLIACLGIYLYEVHRKHVFLLVSAVFLAVALHTKLFVFVFIPAILIELIYIEYKQAEGRMKGKHLWSWLIWGGGLAVVYGAIALVTGIDYTQIIQPFALAHTHFTEQPFEHVARWLAANEEISLLSLGSLLCFRLKKMRLFFIPLVVTLSSFYVFSHHAPIWNHHRMLLMIPAAWLASFAVGEFFSPCVWKALFKETTYKKYFLFFKLGFIGFALMVFALNLRSHALSARYSLEGTTIQQMQGAIDVIHQNKKKDSVLLTDTPSLAFHARVRIPPSLATFSLKQTTTGLITVEKITQIINEGKVGMIAWSRFPKLGVEVMQRVGFHFDLAYQNDEANMSVYVRKPLKGASSLLKGFGKDAVGGRGGRVYTVKNLNSSGPGSLRAGIELSEPRIIKFAVAGVIPLKTPLIVRHPYLTIMGVSAPDQGITLTGAGLIIEASEVIVSHLKIRVGDDPAGPDPEDRDGIAIHVPVGATGTMENIVIDHCSVSWAVDENIGMWIDGNARLRNITISHNIISEALASSIHPEGAHSMGLLVGDGIENVTILGNVFAHNAARNPQLKGGVRAEVIANIMYNPQQPAIGLSDSNGSGPIHTQIVNNFFLPGLNTKHLIKHVAINANVSQDSRLFVANNRGPGVSSEDKGRSLYFKGSLTEAEEQRMQSSMPLWPLGYRSQSFREVLMQAGAFSHNRDGIDQRIVSDILQRTGTHIHAAVASKEFGSELEDEAWVRRSIETLVQAQGLTAEITKISMPLDELQKYIPLMTYEVCFGPECVLVHYDQEKWFMHEGVK